VTAPGPVLETIQFPVRGMTCSSCVNRIARAIGKVDGVTRVRVDLGRELVTVRREPALVSNATLAAAVTGAGYEADVQSAVVVAPGTGRSPIDRLLGRT
jgi:Cu+-exporting ATPase